MTSTLENVCQEFSQVARPILLKHFTPNCCIGASAVTIKVLRALGFQATPLPVKVRIYNPEFIRQAVRMGKLPSPTELQGNSWAVGIGWPAPHLTDFIGHLVVIASASANSSTTNPGGWFLIDASIQQASRPNKDLVLPPVLIKEVPLDFRLGRSPLTIDEPFGLLIYQPFKNMSWRRAPDWLDSKRHAQPVQEILDKLSNKVLKVPNNNDEQQTRLSNNEYDDALEPDSRRQTPDLGHAPENSPG